MKLFHHAISLVAVIAQASAALKSSIQSDLDGWYSCSEFTFAIEGGSAYNAAECAVYHAPLCHPGICKTPKSVDPTIDIFVKRISAANNSETASNVWLLQGGPGDSSTDLESAMVEIHAQMNGAVNVYTMDHRGTGRSTLLDCVSAQAPTTNSPSGIDIDPSKVPACAKALERKDGDLSSFSVTSAATDVATFISDHSNGARTIVYGTSYGTLLVERLIHFNLLEVTGFDSQFGDVGDAFLALCATTSECNERFMSKDLSDTLQDLLTRFDDNPNSTCTALVSESNSKPSSHILRQILAYMLLSDIMRTFIPPVVYRLNRCRSKDIGVLTHFFTILEAYLAPTASSAYRSGLLQLLINYSEMWEKPMPSTSEMTLQFTNARMSHGGMYYHTPLYCAFSKEKSAVYDELGVGSYDANGIIYEVDEYWNKSATIPAQASVLLLNGKLDAQTPHKYAESLLEALDGDKKELITFEYAPHGIIFNAPFGDGGVTCDMKLLLSYVTNDGDLELLDKSCVDEMPAFSMTPLPDDQYYFLSTDNLYDGVYDKSLSAGATSSSSSLAEQQS